MANEKNDTKKVSNKKSNTNSTKKTSKNTKKVSSTKSTNAKKSTSKTTTKKNTPSKSAVKKTVSPKKEVQKKNKELEKTIIIEDIENKINDIVDNKKVKIEEQIVDEIKIHNVAKLENAKYGKSKKNKHLLAIGVIISLLGIIALIVTLIANRIVDKEFISDNAIILMTIASILIEIFGAFIIVNES